MNEALTYSTYNKPRRQLLSTRSRLALIRFKASDDGVREMPSAPIPDATNDWTGEDLELVNEAMLLLLPTDEIADPSLLTWARSTF